MFGIDLATLKVILGYDEDDETRDAALQMLLNGALQNLKNLTGRRLVLDTYRDTFGYRSDRLYLNERPLTSVEAVKLGGVAIASSEYQVFLETGRIQFRNCGTYVQELSIGNYLTVDYTAGYATLPADMLMAIYAAVQAGDNFSKQQTNYGGQVKRITVQDVGSTDFVTGAGSSSMSVMRDTLTAQLAELVNDTPTIGAGLLHETEVI